MAVEDIGKLTEGEGDSFPNKSEAASPPSALLGWREGMA